MSKPTALDERVTALLKSRKSRQMLRSLEPAPAPDVPLVDFSSNDYLSFGRSKRLRESYLQALSTLPSPYGPPSSRLLDGNSHHHLALEAQLATFFRADAGLLFNSGFDANVGLWSSLPDRDDWIVYDELIHASVHDGMRASRVDKARRRPFKHNDCASLEAVLRDIVAQDFRVQNGKQSVWIGVETLYSMDGDLAPLKSFVRASERLLPKGNGHMVVDEAHSTGLYGPQGRGVVCALGLANRITVRVHTFGKAMACSGGVVLCSPLLRSYLINYARTLIYSTAMPHLNVIAVQKSFEMLELGHGDASAAHVHHLATILLQDLSTFLSPTSHPIALPATLSLVDSGPTTVAGGSVASTSLARIQAAAPGLVGSSPNTASAASSLTTTLVPMVTTSPIIPLITTSPRVLSRYLIEHGFLVRPIAYPTVPRGQERVRVCLHAGNTEEQVRRLSGTIRKWVSEEKQRENEAQRPLAEERAKL